MIEHSELKNYSCDGCNDIKNELYDIDFEGLGFDYPITICKDCMEQLIKEYEELK